MGMFWATFLYNGRLMSGPATARLHAWCKDTKVDPSRFLLRLSATRTILHKPGKCLRMGFIDEVLERDDIERGMVDVAEVDRWLAKPGREADKAAWLREMSVKDAALFKQLLAAAAPKGTRAEAGVYICQGMWTSYELDSDGGMDVQANLRVGDTSPLVTSL